MQNQLRESVAVGHGPEAHLVDPLREEHVDGGEVRPGHVHTIDGGDQLPRVPC